MRLKNLPRLSVNKLPTQLGDCLRALQAYLAQADIENPALDTRLLAAHALGMDRVQLLTASERMLSRDEQERLIALTERRAAHEPVARILGVREFWGLPFALNEATLEPRPDSETLIETVLKLRPVDGAPPLRILDLGTGTGCLQLALLHEYRAATGLGIDLAPRAVEQARMNAQNLELDNRAEFRVGNWLEGIREPFDIILSNPPYIRRAIIPALQPDVRDHDPMLALDGGEDGLAPYCHLIPLLPNFLKPGGLVVFEVGYDQAADVRAMLAHAGFLRTSIHKDLGGMDRCVVGYIP